MNVFSYELVSDRVNPTPKESGTKFVVDDNIGEAVHIHYRNLRIEMPVEDFETFAENVREARERLENGDH